MIQAVSDFNFHARHKRQAEQLIESMTTGGSARKSDATFKQCDEYARDVLGSAKYAPWLKAYSVFAGTFKEGWIPDNYYGRVVGPQLQGDYGLVSHYKAISSRLFKTDLLPDVAYSVNGLLFDAAMQPIKPDALKATLFAETDKVVLKLDSGGQGRSIFVYDADSLPANSITFANGVFQSYIVQHPFFDAFDPGSVSTLRLTTVVDNEANVSCRAAYLRIPRRAETHVKSETALKVAVDIDTGRLSDVGYLPNWVSIACHPDSQQAFAGQVVPNFKAVVDACVSLHRTLPFARVIGWDVVVDKNEQVAIMEWNGEHNDIKFSEAATGPCFADLNWPSLHL